MTSWTSDMQSVWEDSVAEWGDVLVYGGNQIPCEKTEISNSFPMEISGSNRIVTTAIDVLRSDAVSIGLYIPETQNNPAVKRPIVLVSGVSFCVVEFKDDITADPTIKLMCQKLQ